MIDLQKALDASSGVESARPPVNDDLVRIMAMWSWLRNRPNATLKEFLGMVQRYDALFAREVQK